MIIEDENDKVLEINKVKQNAPQKKEVYHLRLVGKAQWSFKMTKRTTTCEVI
jgi:hypothetical protein